MSTFHDLIRWARDVAGYKPRQLKALKERIKALYPAATASTPIVRHDAADVGAGEVWDKAQEAYK